MAAKTKTDFLAEGAHAARSGNCRSPGNEYRMPVFGEGSSWQSKAFAEGFTREVAAIRREEDQNARNAAEAGRGQSARDYMHAAGVNAVIMNNLPRDTMAGVSIPFPSRMPEATRRHILLLEESQRAAARNNDGSKLVRLVCKVEKLYARWG